MGRNFVVLHVAASTKVSVCVTVVYLTQTHTENIQVQGLGKKMTHFLNS